MSDPTPELNVPTHGTEESNPRTRDLDALTTEQMLTVINDEDQLVAGAVRAVIPAIAAAVDVIAAKLAAGGRLFYVGAGTSGRLGVLDASECPPTFGVDTTVVQALIAGGRDAVFTSAEGAEDDPALGVRAIAAAGVTAGDVVCGIAASGRTPYVLGALGAARQMGAATVAVTCNRDTPLHRAADIVIDPVVGGEVIAGSTRLKAGTAQKLVLNMLSTGAMVRLGRTYGNLMVGVQATNAKLRVRARRLVETITGGSTGVDEALAVAGDDVRIACLMLLRNLSVRDARARLDAAGGSLRRALG